ncbi:hypothetical protein NPIL_333791 [Nephila pilipes]|uniref:Secreted protein n=1 Tax=Nephila pilipes TaxID=299642 RepID=A0A8X6NIQ8_NEPPI|nr:hypothetical protein NPIL_333791 [Nephila pilipes]
MHFGGFQCCISIFVFLNFQVIATGQDVERNFSTTEGPTSEKDDIDNEDCMKCGLGKRSTGKAKSCRHIFKRSFGSRAENVADCFWCCFQIVVRVYVLKDHHCLRTNVRQACSSHFKRFGVRSFGLCVPAWCFKPWSSNFVLLEVR